MVGDWRWIRKLVRRRKGFFASLFVRVSGLLRRQIFKLKVLLLHFVKHITVQCLNYMGMEVPDGRSDKTSSLFQLNIAYHPLGPPIPSCSQLSLHCQMPSSLIRKCRQSAWQIPSLIPQTRVQHSQSLAKVMEATSHGPTVCQVSEAFSV